MSEILPCPVCGDRNIEYIDMCTKQPVEWRCCNASFRTRGGWNNYSALLARHNTLVEAVAWERECCQDIRPLVAWAGLYVLHGEDYVDAVAEALREIQDAARAEVDRLLQEEK